MRNWWKRLWRPRVLFVTVGGFALLLLSNFWALIQDFALSDGTLSPKASPPGRVQSKKQLQRSSSRWQKNHALFLPGDTFEESTPILPPPSSLSFSVDGSGERYNHSIIYVHVGKTGGITLDTVLRSNCMWYEGSWKRRKCLKALEGGASDGPSMVSELTKATLHFGPRRDFDQWTQNATLFMVTLRNPIARAVSAFNFDHPSNNAPKRYEKGGDGVPYGMSLQHFYHECFPTVQHMADLLQLAEDKQPSALTKGQLRCYDTAKKTLAGNGSQLAASHLRMNYEFYNQLSMAQFPDRPLLVVRTEYMWDDLARIDRMLGGNGYFARAGTAYTHGSKSHVVRQGLTTDRGKQTVCCYLAKEMQIYEILVRRAINLFSVEIEITLSELYGECGLGDAVVRNNHDNNMWEENATTEGRWNISGENGSRFNWEKWARAKCPLSI